MKKLKLLSLVLFSLVFIVSVNASLNIDIDVNPSFTVSEQIKFNYTITSTEDIDIAHTPYVDCPKISKPFLGAIKVHILNIKIQIWNSVWLIMISCTIKICVFARIRSHIITTCNHITYSKNK